jgi:hypothetical protein
MGRCAIRTMRMCGLGHGFAGSCSPADVPSHARSLRAIQPTYPMQGTSIRAHSPFLERPVTRTFPVAPYSTRPLGSSLTSAKSGTTVHRLAESDSALHAWAGAPKPTAAILTNTAARHNVLLRIRAHLQRRDPREKELAAPKPIILFIARLSPCASELGSQGSMTAADPGCCKDRRLNYRNRKKPSPLGGAPLARP